MPSQPDEIRRMKSLYDILGVSPTANQGEIRAAYRSKVKEAHPDVGGSSEAFNEIVLAYEILSDEYRRKHYDETGGTADPTKDISTGAIAIIEGLINAFAQREDAKYSDAVGLMCADISNALRTKSAGIEALEGRKATLVDLKERFKTKSHEETILHDILDRKIEALKKAIEAEGLAIAQLNEASSILRRYDFVRENRGSQRATGFVDLSAFGRPVDPLFDTEGRSSKKK